MAGRPATELGAAGAGDAGGGEASDRGDFEGESDFRGPDQACRGFPTGAGDRRDLPPCDKLTESLPVGSPPPLGFVLAGFLVVKLPFFLNQSSDDRRVWLPPHEHDADSFVVYSGVTEVGGIPR